MGKNKMVFMGKNKTVGKYEVHRHSYVSGPNACRSWLSTVEHSHEGGDQPHEHPDTGPAAYTIDKDEWARATGLKGGGRKKFTAKPTGPALGFVVREPLTFDVIFVEQPTDDVESAYVPQRLRLALGARVGRVVLPRKVA